jgi:hypothetical protein
MRLGRYMAFCLVIGLSASAAAQDAPDTQLAAIREMALYARYREARDACQEYLARTDLDATQRNAGLEVLVTVHIAMRDQTNARQVLEQLYARDPGHRLSDPDASPPVLSAFGRARSSPPPPIAVSIEHTPPALTERGPVTLEVTFGEGRDAISEVRVRYRQGDDADFTTTVMNVDDAGVARARLPVLDRTESYEVAYYIEALAPSGTALTSSGTAAEPLTFTMPEARVAAIGVGPGDGAETQRPGGSEDLTALWVTLAIVGVLAAGGAVGGYFIAQEVTKPEDGSLGNVQLPLLSF